MKLVSDFDGVWTLPAEEARAQGLVMDAALAACVPPAERAQAEAWIRAARAAALRDPARYGWAPGERLSAFGDEDPFAAHSALLHYIHQHAGDDPIARRLRDGVAAGVHGNLETFGGWAHGEGVRRVVETRGPGLLPEAASVVRRLAEAGIEVVVVSNSGPEKLVRWFDHGGVPHTVHPERRRGAVRLRGSARKFVLDPDRADVLEIGPVRVDVARPAYESVLRDERPDAVVGDVFSLDLALPLALRRRDPDFAHMRLFWLVRDYTPTRLVRALEPHVRGEVERVEGGLDALASRLTSTSGGS
jgi:hypothetical protein